MITFRLTVHPLDQSDVVEIFEADTLIGAIFVKHDFGGHRHHLVLRDGLPVLADDADRSHVALAAQPGAGV